MNAFANMNDYILVDLDNEKEWIGKMTKLDVYLDAKTHLGEIAKTTVGSFKLVNIIGKIVSRKIQYRLVYKKI